MITLTSRRREVVNVPILGNVAAGQPLLAVENIETYFPIPTEFLPNAETFMLRVKGESMINVGIFDGDNVLVEKQSTARNAARWSSRWWRIPLQLRPFIRRTVISAFSRRMTRWIRSLFQIAQILRKGHWYFPFSFLMKFGIPGIKYRFYYNVQEKNPAFQDSPPAAGCSSDIARVHIPAELFYVTGTKFPCYRKSMPFCQQRRHTLLRHS